MRNGGEVRRGERGEEMGEQEVENPPPPLHDTSHAHAHAYTLITFCSVKSSCVKYSRASSQSTIIGDFAFLYPAIPERTCGRE